MFMFVHSHFPICILPGIPYRCETDDTAQYTAVASNIHGQVSTQASVIVKSKFGKANIDTFC